MTKTSTMNHAGAGVIGHTGQWFQVSLGYLPTRDTSAEWASNALIYLKQG